MADQLERVSADVAQLTQNLAALANHGKQAQEDRKKRDDAMDHRMQSLEQKKTALTAESQLSANFSPQIASQTWGPPEMDPSWQNRPLTGAETAHLIQVAFDRQVRPAVGKIVADHCS